MSIIWVYYPCLLVVCFFLLFIIGGIDFRKERHIPVVLASRQHTPAGASVIFNIPIRCGFPSQFVPKEKINKSMSLPCLKVIKKITITYQPARATIARNRQAPDWQGGGICLIQSVCINTAEEIENGQLLFSFEDQLTTRETN